MRTSSGNRSRTHLTNRQGLLAPAILSLALLAVNSVPAATLTNVPAAPVTPLDWSVRMANSEIERLGGSLAWRKDGKAKWDYTTGLFTFSLLQLNQQVPDPRYVKFVE